MKAIDYIKNFVDLDSFIKEFVNETKKLAQDRTKHSVKKLPVYEGIIREQKSKFNAVAVKIDSLKQEVFEQIIASAIPDYQELKKEDSQKKDKEKQEDNYVENYRKNRKFIPKR